MIPVVSEEAPLDPDSREMWYIMTRRQHLLTRRAILLEMKEFLENNSLTGGVLEMDDDDDDGPSELEKIDNELQSLSERETALVNRRCLWEKQAVTEPEYVTPEGNKKDVLISGVCILPNATPDFITQQPLPLDKDPNEESTDNEVVDVENLTLAAAKVRCPSCQQNITTEIQYKVGKSSYFLCLLAIFMGCVAGCCLLPFFLNYFKEVCHVCPSCHTEIRKVPRM